MKRVEIQEVASPQPGKDDVYSYEIISSSASLDAVLRVESVEFVGEDHSLDVSSIQKMNVGSKSKHFH